MPQLQLTDILQLQQFNGLTDQEALTIGNQVTLFNPNATAYTYSGLGAILAAANVDQSILFNLPGFVKSLIGGDSLDAFLMSGGCAFGEPAVIQQLQANAVAQANNAINLAAINAMLAMQGTAGTLWSQYGCPQPTLSAITAARVAIADQTWVNNARVLMQSLVGQGIAAIKAAIAGA